LIDITLRFFGADSLPLLRHACCHYAIISFFATLTTLA